MNTLLLPFKYLLGSNIYGQNEYAKYELTRLQLSGKPEAISRMFLKILQMLHKNEFHKYIFSPAWTFQQKFKKGPQPKSFRNFRVSIQFLHFCTNKTVKMIDHQTLWKQHSERKDERWFLGIFLVCATLTEKKIIMQSFDEILLISGELKMRDFCIF